MWSIPKGELEPGESPRAAMRREFIEEMGVEPPPDNHIDLGTAKASGGKTNYIWAVESDMDLSAVHCDSMVTMEWPRGSGKQITFPENDRAEWITIANAHTKIFKNQAVFIERLANHLGPRLS